VTESSRDIELRRGQFFEYFRGRLSTVRETTLPSPDRMVLLMASLDALANHWERTAGLAQRPASSADRMRLFLTLHGGHNAFDRVSVPLLREQPGAKKARNELGSFFPFARYRTDRMNQVSTWSADPTFKTLEDANLVERNALVDCSYGGILYKRLRCGWIHELAPPQDQVIAPDNHLIVDEPYYRFVTNHEEFLLFMPTIFLVSTLERVLASFERETTRLGILPFKEG
jgi:hypothetical protein